MDNRKFLVAAAVSAPPAPSSPSSGYPSDGTPATVPGAFWFHAIGEELRNVITAAGLTPTLATLTQLKAAMDVLYAPAAGASKTGVVAVGDYTSISALQTVTFPTAFPATCDQVFTQVEDPNGVSTVLNIISRDRFGFTFKLREMGSDVQNCSIQWRAYGS